MGFSFPHPHLYPYDVPGSARVSFGPYRDLLIHLDGGRGHGHDGQIVRFCGGHRDRDLLKIEYLGLWMRMLQWNRGALRRRDLTFQGLVGRVHW